MPKTKKPATKSSPAHGRTLRESSSGRFLVATTAKPSKRFTAAQIRDAVRKVNTVKA